jgi:hypothetical protein
VELSFYWDAFGIEEMLQEKMVALSFGGIALGVSRARVPTQGHLPPELTCL